MHRSTCHSLNITIPLSSKREISSDLQNNSSKEHNLNAIEPRSHLLIRTTTHSMNHKEYSTITTWKSSFSTKESRYLTKSSTTSNNGCCRIKIVPDEYFPNNFKTWRLSLKERFWQFCWMIQYTNIYIDQVHCTFKWCNTFQLFLNRRLLLTGVHWKRPLKKVLRILKLLIERSTFDCYVIPHTINKNGLCNQPNILRCMNPDSAKLIRGECFWQHYCLFIAQPKLW